MKFFIICTLFATGLAMAQDSELSGTVRDSSGAVVPRATVHLTNKGTGISRNAAVNNAGVYNFPSLPPGLYDLEAVADGFKKAVRTDLKIDVSERAQLDFALEVGAVQESVTVSASGEVLNTTSGSVGNVVDQRTVVQLPLNGRNYLQLALLQPNVFPATQNSTLTFNGVTAFNIAGSNEIANHYILDGVDNNDQITNQPLHQPVLDAVQEFRVLTGTYSAEYGLHSGGQIIVVTKSGTNEVHGTLWDFYRNSVFDARNFFAQQKLSFLRSQYGATIGAPIRKNKTFFFGSWENQNRGQGTSLIANVPSVAFRGGNFSSLSTVLKNPLANNAPFAGNIIPASMFSAIGVGLLNLYPTPNQNNAQNNTLSSASGTTNSDQMSIRVDHRLTDKDQIYGVYELLDSTLYLPLSSGSGARTIVGYGSTQYLRTQQYNAGWTRIISSRLVNEAHVGFSRLGFAETQQDVNNNVIGTLGIQGLTDVGTVPLDTGSPQVSATGYATVGSPTNLPQARHDNNYDYVENMTFSVGNHTMKWGADMRRFLFNSFIESTGRGSFAFQGSYTGNAVADLLLGLPFTAARTIGSPYAHPRSFNAGFYFQDDWRVSPKLTINLGIRYELDLPPTEKLNKISSFDPSNGTLLDAQGFVMKIDPTSGLLVSTPDPSIGPRIYNIDWKNVAPRLGIAYRPFGDKTVIRVGFGTFYDYQIIGNGLTSLFRSAPFRLSQTVTFQYPTIPNLANPFAGNPAPSAPGIDPNFKTAYVNEWSFGIQHELRGGLLLDVTYQGSEGHDLPSAWQINQALPGPGAVQSRRPYPLWGAISGGYVSSILNSNFNSLQARIERRFSKGLSFSASYVWSKSIDEGVGVSTSDTNSSSTAQNFLNLGAERGLSDFNVPQRMIAQYVYNLPFAMKSNRVVNGVISGWQLTGILTLQKGNPFTVYDGTDISGTGGGQDRPNLIGNPKLSNPSPTAWFNTCTILATGALSNCLAGEKPVWQIQPAGTFGNAGRSILQGPGLADFDLGLYRQFKVTERIGIQFRSEFFNLANHPNFYLPATTVQSSSFGSITQANDQPLTGAQRQAQFALKIVF